MAERAGVIVAGGRSTRFGDEDKLLADLAGVPVIRRVADRLGSVVDELVVNCRTDQVEDIDRALSGPKVAFAVDSTPDRGPLAGLLVGLRATDAEYAAVVAGDMPLIDPAFVASLFERAAGYDAAIPRFEARLQPVQAVYRRAAMVEASQTALARGEYRLTAALGELETVVVEESEIRARGDTETLTNVNTREELARAAERIGAASGPDDETSS